MRKKVRILRCKLRILKKKNSELQYIKPVLLSAILRKNSNLSRLKSMYINLQLREKAAVIF